MYTSDAHAQMLPTPRVGRAGGIRRAARPLSGAPPDRRDGFEDGRKWQDDRRGRGEAARHRTTDLRRGVQHIAAGASRLAVLVDADAYFRAFVETAARARESIMIIAWDIQAATPLQPAERRPDGLPPTLREFLNALLAPRRRLRAHLLEWDYSLVFLALLIRALGG